MKKLFLGVASLANHMTDESHQLQLGMQHHGWRLCGAQLGHYTGDVASIVDREKPDVVIIADKREWDERSFRHGVEAFYNLEALKGIPTVGIIKDAQWWDNKRDINWDRFICYYEPHIVASLSYRPVNRLIRTYHSIDAAAVPETEGNRARCVLSGALLETYYPLRHRLSEGRKVPWDLIPHPGYHENGCHSVAYLDTLSRYQVSICTASKYNYLLRKIIESTACGCVVISNIRESVPYIDGNIVRIRDDASVKDVKEVVESIQWNKDAQTHWARICKEKYDYRYLTGVLDKEIEAWVRA
jgi:hypothetical protein